MNSSSPSVTSSRAENSALDTSQLYRQGVIAGTIGAAVIAIWFLLLDFVQGRPLFTPTLLGTVLFKGVGELTAGDQLAVSFDMVMQFTFVHWLVFVVIGAAASRLLGSAERDPNLGFGILLLFVVVEFGFLAVSTMFASPILQELTWVKILIGNLLAVLGMGWYFWRQHPDLTIHP